MASESSRYKEIERFRKDLDMCMKCGFCTSACPVYKEELVESAVARGKNQIIRGLLSGKLEYSPELEKRLDKCTLCRTCTVNCPAGVEIPSVIIAARADKFRNRGIKFPYNFIYRSILPRRVLFGKTVKAAGLVQKAFFPKGEGTLRHLPLLLTGTGKGRHLPQISSRFLRQTMPVLNRPQGSAIKVKAGYMTGCLTDYVFPELGKKIINFLNRNGVEVAVPREQGCCGAPVFMGAGDFDTGRKMADKNVAAFKDLDWVIVDCATCGSAMQDYVKYLADTPERQKAYTEFGKKIIHITAFLTDVLDLSASAFRAAPEIKGKTVTWHDPCHLNRHMGVKEQPRNILKSIPDIKYVEMAEAERCCGMAGTFNLHFYDISTKIAERKLKNIIASGAEIVATGCPGCIIQLRDTIARHKSPVKVMHIMELLD